MQKTSLNVPDIVCDGCAGAIKRALAALPGITDVRVNIETKEVVVEHEASTTRADIVASLDRAAFPVSG